MAQFIFILKYFCQNISVRQAQNWSELTPRISKIWVCLYNFSKMSLILLFPPMYFFKNKIFFLPGIELIIIKFVWDEIRKYFVAESTAGWTIPEPGGKVFSAGLRMLSSTRRIILTVRTVLKFSPRKDPCWTSAATPTKWWQSENVFLLLFVSVEIIFQTVPFRDKLITASLIFVTAVSVCFLFWYQNFGKGKNN